MENICFFFSNVWNIIIDYYANKTKERKRHTHIHLYWVWRKFCNISYFTYIWTQVNDTILILLSKDRPWKTVQIVWIDLSIVWLRRTTSRVAPCSILVKEISSCKIEFNFQIGHYWQTRTKDIADTQESKKKKPTNQISRLLKDIRRDVMGPNVYLLRLLLDRTCVKSLFYIHSLFSPFSPCRDTCTHVKAIILIKALLPKKNNNNRNMH